MRDALSGEPIPEFFVLGRIHGQWFGDDTREAEAFLTPAFDRWVICADGHRPASGDFARARRVDTVEDTEPELWLINVALEPGWGAPILFQDGEDDSLLVPEFKGRFGPPLPGVRVLADHEPVAESGQDGLALLDLSRAPEQLDFELPGWIVAARTADEGLRLVLMARR